MHELGLGDGTEKLGQRAGRCLSGTHPDISRADRRISLTNANRANPVGQLIPWAAVG